MSRYQSLSALLAVVGMAAQVAPSAFGADAHAAAKFRVTTNVVNAQVQPFTATMGGAGNSLLNFSFEPAEFRTRFFAEGDAPDRVVQSAKALTQYNSFREGFYDGATVRVYRVVNGAVQLVRQDTVPVGGSHLSGWQALTEENSVIAPEATHGMYRFDDWARPGAPYWFVLRAVDAWQ